MGVNFVYHIHVGRWEMFCGHKLDGGTRHSVCESVLTTYGGDVEQPAVSPLSFTFEKTFFECSWIKLWRLNKKRF